MTPLRTVPSRVRARFRRWLARLDAAVDAWQKESVRQQVAEQLAHAAPGAALSRAGVEFLCNLEPGDRIVGTPNGLMIVNPSKPPSLVRGGRFVPMRFDPNETERRGGR